MPSPSTIDEFLDLVRKSAVVDEKRLAAHLDRLRAGGTFPTEPNALAGLLVRDGLLTHFQAEQLLQGKWRRFSIGKYKVLERLGAGGMGSVYLCEHKLMRRRVALKVLPTAKAEDPSSLERFYREARAVAALDHPNIVRAYDIDQEDKLHFLVMEHVDGASLQEIIKKTGPMDVLRACHYVRQAALGLQHAHETAGLVHRDIKPGNILVDRNGIVKVLDMGLARFFHDEEDILTKKYDENVLGTADYLAPEQALDSHSVDIRADVYSLGATFYFCLTARTPFAEGTVAQKLIWHQTRQPKPLRALRPEVPEGVAALIEKMMAKDPAQRYQTPQAVADVLAPWTQTPIPPPPDEEMPQFSLAAMGGSASEATLAGRTVSGGEPSPVPRKTWQVPATPAPTTPSPPLAPAPAARAPGSPAPVARAPASPAPAAAAPAAPSLPRPGPSVPTSPAPATPACAAVAPATPAARPADTIPAPQSPAANGAPPRAPSAPAAPRPASPPSPVEEESPVWDKLGADTDDPTAKVDTAPRRPGRPGAGRKRTAPPPVDRRRLWWLLGGVAATACVLVAVLVWLALRQDSETDKPVVPVRPVIRVNPTGNPGTVRSLTAALNQIRGKPALGGRIILEQDVTEEIEVIKLQNVTVETEEGHPPLTWKAVEKRNGQRLLFLSYAADFHLKNVILDGEGREEALIDLFGTCPGTTLENVEFKGMGKYGVRVLNCEGGQAAGRQVSLSGLTFNTAKPDQVGLFFDTRDNIPSIPKNRDLVVRDCRFNGPGVKIKVADLAKMERVELPDDIKPVVGR
jgi:serine/threonine protein kinase